MADPLRKYIVGPQRCGECGREHLATWPVDADSRLSECDYCGAMACEPSRPAVALETWPEVASSMAVEIVEYERLEVAHRTRES